MKKIGIVTFHTALNYGAVLQSYALQQFCLSLGIENEILDYRSEYIKKTYKPFSIFGKNFLAAFARGVLFSKNIKLKEREFKKFISSNLILSKPLYTKEDLIKIRDNYDILISGSDQVFSPISAGFDENYFLTFANSEQKFSYAASFGVNKIPDDLKKEYKGRLIDFQKISVRENSGLDILDNIDFKGESLVHIDPTLLLSCSQWEKIIKTEKEFNDKYVLLFNVEKCINDFEFAKKISSEKGIKLLYINERTIFEDRNVKYFKAPAVETFLQLFKNAEVIVTNSFHGTVFSIIFHKTFFVELENKKHRNVRVENLLRTLEIENRDITCKKFNEINWQKVDELLLKEREKSAHYLKEIASKE